MQVEKETVGDQKAQNLVLFLSKKYLHSQHAHTAILV